MNQYIPFYYTIILPIHQVKTGKKITAHIGEPQPEASYCLRNLFATNFEGVL